MVHEQYDIRTTHEVRLFSAGFTTLMPQTLMNQRKSLSAIDLFCGAGGLTRGLIDAGVPVIRGFDIDPACRFPFEFNNKNAKFELRDVNDICSSEVENHYPKNAFRILVGCAPCQPFSSYSRQFRRHSRDNRWGLLKAFSRIACEIRPDVISMENVPQICDHSSFAEFRRSLIDAGYTVSEPHCVFGPDYGLPQLRRRVVFFASLHGTVTVSPPTHNPTNYVTLFDAIGGLEPIEAGEASDCDNMHMSPKLSTINLKRIKASAPGGTWRDWPKNLRLECHNRKSGATYPSVYGRMEWNKPAPTLTTQFYGFGNGRFGHPKQHRAISLREGAILQSFPFDYQFVPEGETVCFRSIGRMIGNAVPVKLGKLVGMSIRQHLRGLANVKN